MAENDTGKAALVGQQAKIYYLKSLLNNELIVNRNACMDGIRNSKYIIKALRKQIAMNVLVKKVGNKKSYVCPNCHAEAGGYCWYCGQKLRWQE